MKNEAQKIIWYEPNLDSLEQEYVSQVIKSNYINDGDKTREFETRLCEWLGVKHGVMVTSGTAAIFLALAALGIGPGDEVIVPDFTFIATANAVRLTGATVKLVDIELENFTIDPIAVRRAINDKTKAIIPVDVNGRGAAYQELLELCKEFSLYLVSDSAEALASQWNGSYLGTQGEAGCFSFSANKTITTGQGGMVVTDNTELCYRLRELKDQGRRFSGTGGNDIHPVIGYNFKITNLQAAVGLAQLQKLPSHLKQTQQRDQWYFERLKNCNFIKLPNKKNNSVILQWTDVLCEKRDLLQRLLLENNIESRAFWHPLHRQAPYLQPDRDFPNAIKVSEQGLWLPSAFRLTHTDIERVCDVIYQAKEKSLLPAETLY